MSGGTKEDKMLRSTKTELDEEDLQALQSKKRFIIENDACVVNYSTSNRYPPPKNVSAIN